MGKEKDEDANDGQKLVEYWIKQIDSYRKSHDDWIKKGWIIVEKYRDDKKRTNSEFNILWSNTETLKSSLYSNTPTPSATRRYKDADPLGAQVSEVLKRNIEYSVDSYNFDEVINSCVEDYCLPGRMQARVKYKPTFEKYHPLIPVEPIGYEETLTMGAEGQMVPANGSPIYPEGTQFNDEIGAHIISEHEEERLVNEEVQAEYVHWEDYAHDINPQYSMRKWEAFRGKYTRKEAVEKFGKKGYKLQMDTTKTEYPNSTKLPDKRVEVEPYGIVWEIWDKDKRRQLFISPSYPEEPLLIENDPLNLLNFFCSPEPVLAVSTNNSSIPIPLYTLYQDQAEELNKVTERITFLVSRLKVTGMYNAVNDALARIAEVEDGTMIPIDGLGAGVKIDDMISYWPIGQIAEVLSGLYRQREEIKQVIYDITGLSDLMRGQTDPNETAAAQQLKGKFSTLRQAPRQKAIQRFARDIFRIKAEIMSEKFSPETLSAVANMEVTPEMIEFMRSDYPRAYRIDIETDSTLEPNAQEEQQNRLALLQTTTEFVNAWTPLVQGGVPIKVMKEMLLFGIRSFKDSREIEEAIESLPDQPPPQQQQPSEAEVKAQQQQQEIQANAQIEQQRIQADQQRAQIEAQSQAAIDANKQALEERKFEREMLLKEKMALEELALKERIALAELHMKGAIAAKQYESQKEQYEEDAENANS